MGWINIPDNTWSYPLKRVLYNQWTTLDSSNKAEQHYFSTYMKGTFNQKILDPMASYHLVID